MPRADLEALPEHLRRLYDEVVREAAASPELAAALAAHFGRKPRARGTSTAAGEHPRARHRRAPGVVDPFAVVTREDGGEDVLRAQLVQLSVEQLKDIIAEHAMDTTKLAMKWKTPERLIDLIVSTVRSRLAKGSAFRQT